MSELRECPFCGMKEAQHGKNHNGIDIIQCQWCGAEHNAEDNWQSRPLEDALSAHVAELEAEKVTMKDSLNCDASQMSMDDDIVQSLSASNAKLRDALENAKDKLQNTLDLARTGLAPTPLGLTEEQWLQHKCYRIGSELSRVLEIAEEALTNGN